MENALMRLRESINEMLEAIHLAHNQELFIPALILLYASMDFVASLDREDPNVPVTRKNFMGWVDAYLLPAGEIKCRAIDLYSARCGWLHKYTSKSELVSRGDAKEIFYQFGLHDNEDQLQGAIKDPSVAVAVHFTRLFNAFRDGLDKWEEAFLTDQKYLARVIRNSERLLQRILR